MKKTPLNAVHIQSGAKMVDFGGWHMPVQYSSLAEEHKAVREKAGLFDVSHMGEVIVEGSEALAFINHLITNNATRLVDGQALYSVMCYETGGIVDDLLVYRRGPERYLLCINAGNIEKDWEWMQKVAAPFLKGLTTFRNASDEFCQLALQGPASSSILSKLLPGLDLSGIKYYHFSEQKLLGQSVIVSRTGYTGEDGFEVYAPAAAASSLWNALMEAGKSEGLQPCGLGARDTLRTEMKFPLYGNDISQDTNPLEAGLGWVVKLEKPENFLGKGALQKVKLEGPKRHLIGLKMKERMIARHGYEVKDRAGQAIGIVTSGTLSPTLGYPVAIAYVNTGHHALGTEVFVQIRDKVVPAEVVKTPFVQRK
jgi:aminomethyltransferase